MHQSGQKYALDNIAEGRAIFVGGEVVESINRIDKES
jgi:hypothetical protein